MTTSETEKTPLHALKVVDFGRYIAGPACATMLANFGADVVRVEAKRGNPDRYLREVTALRDGALFLQLANNKRSLALDLKTAEGAEVVRRLILWADVLVANLPEPGLKALGLDWERVHALNPAAILVTNTAFGTEGPKGNHFGFDGVAQAMSGAMHMSGTEAQPARSVVPYVDFFSAMQATIGTLVALRQRQQTGKGQRVQSSLLHSALYMASSAFVEQDLLRNDRRPTGNRSPFSAPSDCLRTKDGWLLVQCLGDKQFAAFAKALGKEEAWASYQEMSDLQRGTEHGAQLSAEVSEWLRDYSSAEAMALLATYQIPSAVVLTPEEVLSDPHIAALGLLQAVPMPGAARPVPLVQHPLKMGNPNAVADYRRPDTLGESNPSVLADLGYADADIADMRERGLLGSSR